MDVIVWIGGIDDDMEHAGAIGIGGRLEGDLSWYLGEDLVGGRGPKGDFTLAFVEECPRTFGKMGGW